MLIDRKEKCLIDSGAHRLTFKAIEQGSYYFDHRDDAYLKNKMIEDFFRELDNLVGEIVMEIYGVAHTDPDAMVIITNDVLRCSPSHRGFDLAG